MDGAILLFIQEYIRNDILTPFFKVITTLGNAGLIWIAITLLLLFNKKTRRAGIISACAMIMSLIVNNLILKNLVARTRPYDMIDTLIPLVKKPTDFSFPSGHTGCAFAAAGVFVRNLPKRAGIPLLILAILIALSRLYVGVHYPTDVLVGFIIGLTLSYLAEWVVTLWEKKREAKEVKEVE